MAPKASASKDVAMEEEVLQAVILADSFNTRFMPLTLSKPRCLLPICNAPLLDWTFESLALAGVQEIFVVVRSHADQVKDAIKTSKWSQPSSGLKIVPIVTAKETFSPGDAMRDIYTHGVITGDFVLVSGDLVSSVRLDEIVRVHKERRRANKDAIMTMVVKPSGARHRARSRGETAVMVLDAETSECLHYDAAPGHPARARVPIPLEVLKEHAEVEIRDDLIDCGIDVCSLEVPSLFQDNFDYQDLRRDFVHGVLTSDLLMKNIHCFVLQEGYAARVKDTRSYDSISKDILARWVFPLVPDDNHPAGHVYEHSRGNKYLPKDQSVVLARTCKIGNNCIIGSSTHVYDNAQVSGSVIGKRCVIGPGARVTDAYIFDDTVLGAGVVVARSIVGSRVSVGPRSVVPRGCLVGDGVVLGEGAQLRPFERVGTQPPGGDDDDSDQEEEGPDEATILQVLGKGSNAHLWPRGQIGDDDELDEYETYTNHRLMRIGDTCSDLDLDDAGSVTGSEPDSDDSASDASGYFGGSGRAAAAAATPADEFVVEVRLSLERAFAEGHSLDNAAVELKTLRMASNVPIARVRGAVVGAIVDRVPLVEGDAAAQRAQIVKLVQRWGALVNRIGGVDQVDAISALQTHCARTERTPLFGQLLAAFYQEDVVEEPHIRRWHALPSAKGAGLPAGDVLENVKKCWAVGGVLIKQFDEQESEDEDESESE